MDVNVNTCSVNPSTVALGDQSILTVTLDAPAPSGGITVIVSFLARDIRDGRFNEPEKTFHSALGGRDASFSIAGLGHCGLMCCPTLRL